MILIAVFVAFSGFLLYAAYSVYNKTEGYERFESVFDNLKLNKKGALAYHNVYCLRRTVVLLVVVFLTQSRISQIYIFLLTAFANVIYSSQIRPFNSKLLNMSELFNEVMVWLCSYPLFCFSQFVPDPEVEYDIGWILIALILALIVFNCTILLIGLIVEIKASFRVRKLKKEYKKKLEEAQKAREAKREIEPKLRATENPDPEV